MQQQSGAKAQRTAPPHRRSWDYVLRSGLAGGVAGCAVRMAADMAQAEQFVVDTLGDLATADAVLRLTVLTYVQERFNGSSTAELLFTHRNTIERRLNRANQLLPRPLADNATSVVAALMFLQLREGH